MALALANKTVRVALRDWDSIVALRDANEELEGERGSVSWHIRRAMRIYLALTPAQREAVLGKKVKS